MHIRVGGAQIPVTMDMDKNKEEIQQAIEIASEQGIQILVFPEGSLSGYTAHFDARHLERNLAEVCSFASKKQIHMALGTCISDDDGCYNSIRFYDKRGAFLGCHTKTLVCGTLDDPPIGEVQEFSVKPLRVFSFDGITVGGLICNDLWANPMFTPQEHGSLVYALRRLGAKIIFHAVNGGRNFGTFNQVMWEYHNASLLLNAAANRVWIVTVDNCEPLDQSCSAPSGVISPDGIWMTQAKRIGRDIFWFDVEI